MVVVNFRLEGALEQKVGRFIRSGYATSKAEVIRLALSSLGEPVEYEDISDDPALESHLRAIKSGKVQPKFVGTDSDIQKYMK